MRRITDSIKRRPILHALFAFLTRRHVVYACAAILALQVIELMAYPQVVAEMLFMSGLALCSYHLWTGRHYTITRMHGGYGAYCREPECVDRCALIFHGRGLLETIHVAHAHHRDHVNTDATTDTERGKS